MRGAAAPGADRVDPARWRAAVAGDRQRRAGRRGRDRAATVAAGRGAVDRRPRAGGVGRETRPAVRRGVRPPREAPAVPGLRAVMGLAEYRRTQVQLADYLPWAGLVAPGGSEEHTSELQALMCNSHAVF